MTWTDLLTLLHCFTLGKNLIRSKWENYRARKNFSTSAEKKIFIIPLRVLFYYYCICRERGGNATLILKCVCVHTTVPYLPSPPLFSSSTLWAKKATSGRLIWSKPISLGIIWVRVYLFQAYLVGHSLGHNLKIFFG